MLDLACALRAEFVESEGEIYDERGAALTQRLLAFARRQELSVDPTDVAGLVRNMTDLIRRSISSEIELTVEVPDVVGALVDANQLVLAILNLAINARDAMPNGGSIALRVEQKSASRSAVLADGGYVSVSVSDTMTPEHCAARQSHLLDERTGKGDGPWAVHDPRSSRTTSRNSETHERTGGARRGLCPSHHSVCGR